MKRYSLLMLAFFVNVCYSQAPDIKTQLPTVIPPAPTVAALMKFEETPVSNYTGIPDISIPLFSSPTYSKDINLDISLKYHPGGVAVDEKASDVGLGWSLFAGGTISRTVRGLPDEIFIDVNAQDNGKVGIYQTPENGKTNTYYALQDLMANSSHTWTSTELELRKEYLYEAQEKGKYDTEQDLWQFNFMGRSGRFFIKKNLSTGDLEVQPLDDYNLKIINQYGITGNAYEPTGFVIYDDKGYSYLFNVVEISETNSVVDNMFPNIYGTTSFSDKISFKSAFHLSEIRDNNNKVLITFGYNEDITKEMTVSGSEKNAIPMPLTAHETVLLNSMEIAVTGTCSRYLEPVHSSTGNFRRTYAKKLLTIEINGISKIDFNFAKGEREDTQMITIDSVYRLKAIIIKDWEENPIKKIQLFHSYPELQYQTQYIKRMHLDSLQVFDKDFDKHQDYRFAYYNQSEGVNLTRDPWGYFTFSSCEDPGGEPNPKYCTLDLLRKILYPTGGCAAFDFESNQYSYVGNYPAEDYEETENFNRNKVNSYVEHTENYSFGGTGVSAHPDTVTLSSVTTNRWVRISSTVSHADQLNDKYLVLTKNDTIYKGLVSPEGCDEHKSMVLLEPGNTYKLHYTLGDTDYEDDIEDATLEFVNTVDTGVYQKYFLGGGNRIGRVRYFKTDVAESYDDGLHQFVTTETPEKEKNYNYNFFNEPRRSSGALAYHKPLYSYLYSNNPCIECNNIPDDFMTDYTITTSYNVFQARKTQGADVGYKNVTVYETNNGRAEYTYTSPIDFPSLDWNPPGYPFYESVPDVDYLTGQNTSEQIYRQDSMLLKETVNTYTTDEFSQTTGLQLKYNNTPQNGCPISKKWKTYALYRAYVLRCGEKSGHPEHSEPSGPSSYVYHYNNNLSMYICFCYCGEPDEFILAYPKTETYGWAKLTAKTSREYFYRGSSSTPDIMQTDETFSYNSLNKQLATHTVTDSNDETLETKYFYTSGDATGHQNRISEIERIEQYKGSTLLSKNRILYNNNFSANAPYLPEYIQASKGSVDPENRIRFKKYDEYGHPTEVLQENGTTVSYIWGYNKSQPIAKIENATNAQIATATGVAFKDITESTLTTVNLRTALPAAMVTTYTYIPLVGVETITDPKGYKTTYEYDSFGRLAKVRDAQGKILSENEYNYRTQN